MKHIHYSENDLALHHD